METLKPTPRQEKAERSRRAVDEILRVFLSEDLDLLNREFILTELLERWAIETNELSHGQSQEIVDVILDVLSEPPVQEDR